MRAAHHGRLDPPRPARGASPRDSSTRRELLARTGGLAGLTAAAWLPPAPPSAFQAAGPAGSFDVRAFGATGRRADNSTGGIQTAVDACTRAGGGVVHVPPGEYTVGMIQLKDNVTLDLHAGATLLLAQDTSLFPRGRRAMIFAEDAANIGVTGRGRLDGLAQYEFVAMRGLDPEIAQEIEIARAAGVDMRRYYRVGVQTYLFILNNCRNVLLRDITLVGSPLWNVRLNDCDRVHVQSVYIHSDLEKGVNADGIDVVSSRNVTISDSIIETADDAIVLKTISREGQPARPTENVTVTNCVLTSSSTALMIGTETEADVRDVLFNNCVIRNSNKGFGINVQDGAVVRNVVISNLTVETNRRHWNWWGSAELCKLVLKKRSAKSRLGSIRDILVDNVVAKVRGTSTIVGHAEGPIEHVRLSNVDVTMLPENAPDKRATHALYLESVRGAQLRDISVRWEAEAEPKWESAVALRRVTDFEITRFRGRQGGAGGPAAPILLDDTADGVIRDSRAVEGATRLVHVRGAADAIHVAASRVPPGRPVATFETPALRQRVRVEEMR